MKIQILIIGQGNIGTFIGSALSQWADYVVCHFVRNKENQSSNLTLNISDRRRTKNKIKKNSIYTYQQTDSLTEIAKADLIFVPVRFTQWREVIETINDYLHKNQTLIICGNVLDDFDWFQKNIPCPYVFAFPNFGGAIIKNKLQGWLTPHFTIGVTSQAFQTNHETVANLLSKLGFIPQKENDIKGWLMTHFAYNAGMLSEAASQDGFQKMTKSLKGLQKMYVAMQKCMCVIKDYGIDVMQFSDGRSVYAPMWWSILKTYFLFLIPGLSKSADATKDNVEWKSYINRLHNFAVKNQLNSPINE
jgi:2-dehydropantoate 2-reductase